MVTEAEAKAVIEEEEAEEISKVTMINQLKYKPLKVKNDRIHPYKLNWSIESGNGVLTDNHIY